MSKKITPTVIVKLPTGVDESILEPGINEYRLSECSPENLEAFLNILSVPPAIISYKAWHKLPKSAKGYMYDDRDPDGALVLYFIQFITAICVVHVKPLPGG